jgi:hypothetical protein
VQVAANNYGDLPSSLLINQLSSWVKATDTATGFIQAPGTAVENWADVGHQYLHVKTVDLRPLFCKVTLIDTAAPEDIAGFNVAVQGNGYPPNSTISVQLAGNTLSFTTTSPDTFVDGDGDLKFTADPPDTLNDNNVNGTYEVDGTIRLGGNPSFSQIAVYNVRRVAPIPNTVIPPGTAEYVGPTSPPDPSYDLIANVGPGAGGFLVDQTQTFYVLKGQSINLFDGADALNRSVIIQSDVQYKYFNNSWNQVD